MEVNPRGETGLVFREHGRIAEESMLIRHPDRVSLVVFTGGEDVSPDLYGENLGFCTYCNEWRDEYECKMFDIAYEHGIPCVGICRGAQLLCVKAGGSLVQDITGHVGGMHDIMTIDDRIITVNSSHHQMQLPDDDAIVLAWADPCLSRHYLDGDNDYLEIEREIEVVYYPKISSIGIQYHPEWLSDSHEAVEYAQEVVRKCLFQLYE